MRQYKNLEMGTLPMPFNIDLDKWEPVIHRGWQSDRIQLTVDRRPCNETALYISKTVKFDDSVKNEDFLGVHGEKLNIEKEMIDYVPCGNCGNPVRNIDIATTIAKIQGHINGKE